MTDSRWKNLALEVIGCFVSALGLYSFAVAAGVPVTGVAGIGAILFRLFGLPIGVTNIIMNIPIVLICFKYLGKDFFFRSVRCMVLFAIFTDYVLAALPVYQGDRMLATICGGVIGGVGDALIYMQNSSTGGLDFITMAIKSRHPHMPFGNLTFMMALIVTSDGPAVCRMIGEKVDRGSTILKGYGGYSQDGRDVVLCACSSKQLYIINRETKRIDPGSFIVMLQANEVEGEGFKRLELGEQS